MNFSVCVIKKHVVSTTHPVVISVKSESEMVMSSQELPFLIHFLLVVAITIFSKKQTHDKTEFLANLIDIFHDFFKIVNFNVTISEIF